MTEPKEPTGGGRSKMVGDALAWLGVNPSTLQGIYLAQGVLGKTSAVVVVGIICMTVIARTVPTEFVALSFGSFIFVVLLIYFFGSIIFASRNPGAALLEGAKLIEWRRLDVASNSAPPIIDHSPTNAPKYGEGKE